MPIAAFLESDVLALEPIRRLSLTNTSAGSALTPLLHELAQRPELAQLRRLDLPPWVLDEGFTAIAKSPHLEELKTLTARDHDITDVSAIDLPSLEVLHLDVDDFNLTNAIGDKLGSLRAPTLRELSIHAQWTSTIADGLIAFLRTHRLERLDLHGHNGMPVEVFRALGVKSLGLGMCGVGSEQLEAVLFPWIERLDLDDNPLVDDTIEMLAKWALPELRSLDLSVGRVPPGWQPRTIANIEPIFSSGWYEHLHTLKLDGRRVRFAASPSLRELSVRNCGIDDDGIAALAATELPAFESLDIASNNITAGGLAELVRAPWFSQLRSLSLGTTFPDGLRLLLATPMPKLQRLAIGAAVPWRLAITVAPRLRVLDDARRSRPRVRCR
jgi:hypothetical protein